MALTEAQKRNAEKNLKYWAEREAEQLRHNITEEREYEKQLKKIYSDMLDACQKEIDAFYGRYAIKEGITIAEAKKRVSQADIKAYERKAKRYVAEKNFSEEANAEMRLYNLTMKVNRLELLKANIGLELVSGYDAMQKFMDDILKGRTEDELKRQAGILGKTIQNNAKLANSIVNSSFHNAKFSDRIWMYQDMLKSEINRQLQIGLIQGKNPRVLAREIQKTFGSSQYNAERLMRTELARVQTEAQKQSFEKNGFKQYTFITNSGCCPICQGLNGKHFLIEKMMPGDNAPPMHPNCRCSVSAYEDSDEYEAWLDYISNGGTTEEWNKLKKSGKYIEISSKSGKLEMNLQIFSEKDIVNQESNSLKRAIRKYESKVSEHEAKIEEPEKYISDWNEKDIREQEGLKNHWKKEIRNFNQSIKDRIEELKKRGDYDE